MSGHNHRGECSNELNENLPPRAKGLRNARLISVLKGVGFFGIGVAVGNPGLAMVSGHDIGDAWALRDEVKASETQDLQERATLIRRAGNKILFFTISSGIAELFAELALSIEHNDNIGLIGSGTSLGLDIKARHGVMNDEHHAHHGIGHTHMNLDVIASSVNIAGTALSSVTHNSIFRYLGAGGVAIVTGVAWKKIRREAKDLETTSE